VAHVARQVGHFGNAAGVVRHRAESVERHHHAGQRQHGGHRDGDAEQPGQAIGDEDAADDHQRRAALWIPSTRPGPGSRSCPWPVTEALAMERTGRKFVPV
jgi:hypothetical protein